MGVGARDAEYRERFAGRPCEAQGPILSRGTIVQRNEQAQPGGVDEREAAEVDDEMTGRLFEHGLCLRPQPRHRGQVELSAEGKPRRALTKLAVDLKLRLHDR